MRKVTAVIGSVLSIVSMFAYGQVYKCTNADGKLSYTSEPCAKTEKSQRMTIKEAPPSTPDQPVARDWQKENEEFKARQKERDAKDNAEQAAWRAASRNSANASNSNKSIIAACEANHGINCSSPRVIEQIKRENTPLTREEQQRAVAERRRREQDEAFERAARR